MVKATQPFFLDWRKRGNVARRAIASIKREAIQLFMCILGPPMPAAAAYIVTGLKGRRRFSRLYKWHDSDSGFKTMGGNHPQNLQGGWHTHF